MRTTLIFSSCILVLLFIASVTIGAVISMSHGHPNPLLIGVFVIDSVAIIIIAMLLLRSHLVRR